jgi:hypothetical protein
MEDTRALEHVPDDELLRRLVALLRDSRRTEADLVAHIAEVDVRRLYAREASPSMFVYCTERLHLSEAEAYLRIAAARASREHPMILAMLADGRLHLTAIAKLAPHLTLENRDTLLQRAMHRTKREVEELVAELAPRPDVEASIRKLPDCRTAVARPSAQIGPRLQPGSDRAGLAAFELRPDQVVSDGLDGVGAREPGVRPEAAHALKLERLSAGGARAEVDFPRAGRPMSRPAIIEPLAPARYRIQFTASAELRDKLERLQAFALGGDHSPGNVSLLCRLHNRHLAEIDYGRGAMDRHRRSRAGSPSPSLQT